VGLACTSSLSVLAGADVVTGFMKIGELTGASGAATVHGAGSTLTSQGLLEVGITGTGNLVLFNGGSASCLGLSLGNGAASSGSCTVSGGLSRLDCGSAGVVMSQNGATSTLNLTGGIVDINGDITDAGAGVSTFVLDAATLDMHNFAIGAGPSPIDSLQFRSGTLKNVAQINNGAGLTKTGPGTLYLNTANTYTGPTTVTQGTLFVVNSTGSATGTGLVSIAAGATLAGPGIIGGLVANDGIVAPEGFVGNPVGTLTVQGTYSQFATGVLRIDIASATSNDRLVVTGGGASVAAGTLDVQLLNSFMPALGDSFTILTAAFISGQFPTTNLPVLSNGLSWQVEYAIDHVRLTVTSSCTADVDDGSGTGTPDGGIGIEDLLYYLGVYDAGVPEADVDDGTETGTPDGGVGIEDLLYYLERYDAGC
jgi:autotransporter-associated beta strand protein/T5SS/PEP-CTERM-associated repeat protein